VNGELQIPASGRFTPVDRHPVRIQKGAGCRQRSFESLAENKILIPPRIKTPYNKKD
jgi:hypothetical protein